MNVLGKRVCDEKESKAVDAASRRRVLVLTSTYLPGVKGGGPIRSIAGLADQLGNDLDLFVLCRDRDYGDREPYAGVAIGEWMELGNAKVQYLPCTQFTASRYRTLLAELRPDVLYLNTLFSVREFIVPAIVALCRHRPVGVVVAPRGCLDPGALSLKSTKKHLFLWLLRASRLPRAMTWQASTDMEARFISEAVGPVRSIVASDLPSASPAPLPTRLHKDAGQLRIIYLSRISPKKNLHFLLEQFVAVRGAIELTIAGPIEDRDYWTRCKDFIDRELGHVQVYQVGTVPHDEVNALLGSHHIFALPTLGENFGHVILEALDSGLGVLVSDRTPWRGLERLGAGWDLSLLDPLAWEAALQACSDMDDVRYQKMSSAAHLARSTFLDVDAIKRDNLALFGVGLLPSSSQ